MPRRGRFLPTRSYVQGIRDPIHQTRGRQSFRAGRARPFFARGAWGIDWIYRSRPPAVLSPPAQTGAPFPAVLRFPQRRRILGPTGTFRPPVLVVVIFLAPTR